METLGSFRIVERLGAGALGTLFSAVDARTGSVVALRIVEPRIAGDPVERAALLADARAAAAFSHPHAAGLLEIVEEGDRLLLVHALAPGQPLEALLGAGPIDTRRALTIALRAAEVLGAAATKGLMHGALDPETILVAGEADVSLLHIGLARWTARGASRRAAAASLEEPSAIDEAAAANAALYVSPEQVLGASGDGRSDVFALGVTLYRMLTGRQPFAPAAAAAEPGAASATLLQILRTSPPPPSQLNLAVPPGVDGILQRALAKSVGSRYPDAAAMAADLAALVTPKREPDATHEDGVLAFAPEPAWDDAPALEAPPEAADVEAKGGLSIGADASAPPAAARSAVEKGDDLPALRSLVEQKTRPAPAASRPGRHGRRGRLGAVAGTLTLVALVAFAGWFFRADVMRLVDRTPPPPPQPPKIVVLPFTVADAAAAYYGVGFAEGIANKLSELPGAAVVGRTAIRSLGSRSDWQLKARLLGATVAIGGSVRPGQYGLHADVEVLDVATGERKFSQHFEREPRGVFALEVDIAGRLAQHFRLPTPASTRWQRAALRQAEPAAFDLYLQGRDAADRRDRARAIALYDEALARDPRLVEARASLALALYLEEYYAGSTREPASAGRALREAEAALAVDAELPVAHIAAALAAPTITGAASSLGRALTCDPSNGEAWHYAGDLVSELQPQASLAFYRASLAFEPTIDSNWRDIASVQAASGDAAGAADSVVKGEALRADRPWWRQMRARLELEAHRYDAPPAAALLTDPSAESTPIVWLMGRVIPLAMAGRLADARREANTMTERYPAFCEGRAVLAAVELDGGSHSRGTQLASAILTEAARPGAGPEMMACAALAAAATGDAAETAGWLSRLAADERGLRVWTRQAIFGLGLSFRSRWYPWSKVVGAQPVEAATAQLDARTKHLSEEVSRRLPSPPTAASAR